MLKAPFYEEWISKRKEVGDYSYNSKHAYSQDYDLILTNILSKSAVMLLNLDLIREIHLKDMIDKLVKKFNGFEAVKFIV